jgi:hypothetical protein
MVALLRREQAALPLTSSVGGSLNMVSLGLRHRIMRRYYPSWNRAQAFQESRRMGDHS